MVNQCYIYTASYSLRSSNFSSFTTPSKISTHSFDLPPPYISHHRSAYHEIDSESRRFSRRVARVGAKVGVPISCSPASEITEQEARCDPSTAAPIVGSDDQRSDMPAYSSYLSECIHKIVHRAYNILSRFFPCLSIHHSFSFPSWIF